MPTILGLAREHDEYEDITVGEFVGLTKFLTAEGFNQKVGSIISIVMLTFEICQSGIVPGNGMRKQFHGGASRKQRERQFARHCQVVQLKVKREGPCVTSQHATIATALLFAKFLVGNCMASCL